MYSILGLSFYRDGTLYLLMSLSIITRGAKGNNTYSHQKQYERRVDEHIGHTQPELIVESVAINHHFLRRTQEKSCQKTHQSKLNTAIDSRRTGIPLTMLSLADVDFMVFTIERTVTIMAAMNNAHMPMMRTSVKSGALKDGFSANGRLKPIR